MVALLAAATLLLAACSGDEGPGTLSAWKGNRATLTVPLDHDDPDGPTIEVPVWRREAADPGRRIGVLLVNPGGPGFPAGPLVQLRGNYTDELLAHFDIVALDPRGTFAETAVPCLADLSDIVSSVDWTPDAPGESEALDAALQSEVDDCAAEYADLLPHVSTMDTVHDMALLVEALGEEQVSYLGFSYGSALGAAFATTYPELVRAAVFDGAYHPNGDPLDEAVAEVEAIEAMLIRIFEACDASADCPIQDGARAAFERVATAADIEPFAADPGLPVVNQMAFDLIIVRGDHAYGGSARQLLSAVAAADAGDPVPLQRLFSGVSAFLAEGASAAAIICMDWPYRGASPLPDDAFRVLEEAAPVYHSILRIPEDWRPIPNECERWPTGPDLYPTPLSGEGAGPLLVITASGDPVTPIGRAKSLSADLVNDTLLVVEDNRHVSYDPIRVNPARRCATDLIDAFLIDLTPPPEEMVCER